MVMLPVLFAVPSILRDNRSEKTRADRAREEQAFYEQEAIARPWKSALKVLAPVVMIFGLTWAIAGLASLVR